jgi:hypothetical protein
MSEVSSGGSVMSQNDLRLHFGLGDSASVDTIEVKWPTTGVVDRFEGVPANQILTIKEGAGVIAPHRPKVVSEPQHGPSATRDAAVR